MRNTDRLTTREAADLLGVSISQLRNLSRGHGLGYRAGRGNDNPPSYSGRMVRALKSRREGHTAPGRISRQDAADLLGIKIDRLNQLIRDEEDQLGRKHHPRGRVSLSKARVEALKRRRSRAPQYPRSGSVWPEAMKKP
jgi:hypothetical protein